MTHDFYDTFGRNAGSAVDPGWKRTVDPQSAVKSPVSVEAFSEFLQDPCPPSDQTTQEYKLREQMLVMATQQAVDVMDRELLKRTIITRFDQYPRTHSTRGHLSLITGGFEFFAVLPRVPISSFDRVEWVDQDGTTETIAAEDYDLDDVSEPHRLHIHEPTIRDGLAYFAGLRVHYDAGYAADAVPEAILLGIKMHAAYLYERRGMNASGALKASGAMSMYEPWRIRTGL